MTRHLALILFLAAAMTPVHAANLFVPSNYPTIQAAVEAANSGDVVLVAPGIYDDVTHEAGPTDTTKCVVVMRSGVTVRGSGPGITVIDALGLGRGFHCDGVTNAAIENLTVRGAFAQVYGAGIYCRNGSSPSIFNCEITQNLDGGIICIGNSSPSINHCWMTDNVNKQGGGLAIENSSSPIVNGATITGNEAPSGAGVYIRNNCAPQFLGCIISGNTVSSPLAAGGGIAIVSASPTMTDCIITDNIATGTGGGIAVLDNSTVTVSGCRIQGNETTDDYGSGGGVYLDFSAVTLEDCTISGNTVAGEFADGGGIYAAFATSFDIRRCSVADNGVLDPGSVGGGVSLFYASPNIEKSIIAFNGPGQAIFCFDENSNPVISCCDVYGNTGGDGLCGTDGGQNFSQDPLFCDLVGRDLRLQSGSPCLPGQHPGGPTACDGDQIGAEGIGCGSTSVGGDAPIVHELLRGNDPNPFRPPTTIRYDIPRDSHVRLEVFDVLGRGVRLLVDGPVTAGSHGMAWDGRMENGEPAPSGIYFYRLAADGRTETRSMVLTR